MQQKTVKYWESAQELGSVVSRSLIRLIRDNPSIGWVRGDAIASDAAQTEILSLRAQLAEMKSQLEIQPDRDLGQGCSTLSTEWSVRGQLMS